MEGKMMMKDIVPFAPLDLPPDGKVI